ncbi:hypothetical protein GCM10027451_43190 [Geodermatophilus aquaeductus]|jgi:maltose O-acetyltransferase|uniref:Maltose O-acetyltransferase n=1 Tax=Geodermatophilus aquaeductus TaxID=1564161 RepID=A0A521FQM1_9ACTN|nr:acyltransferase [Geodermatophilus aquaeductus]SMO98515.1 maltose O-acetyltransferase [Geodermatophilus aquaeductus]
MRSTSEVRIRPFLVLASINTVAMSHLVPARLRRLLLRWSGMRIGDAWVAAGCLFRGTDVVIGDDSRIGYRVFFDFERVTIGRGVSIGTDVKLLSASHQLGDARRRAADQWSAPIEVCDGVWLGAGVTVLPGVTIREGCVVGAGAVVVEDTEPHGLYAGVPATRRRDLDRDTGPCHRADTPFE